MDQLTTTVRLSGVLTRVVVTYQPGWSQPAKLNGHPDSWAPEEGEQPEILEVVDGSGANLLRALSTAAYDDLVRECSVQQQHASRDHEPYGE